MHSWTSLIGLLSHILQWKTHLSGALYRWSGVSRSGCFIGLIVQSCLSRSTDGLLTQGGERQEIMSCLELQQSHNRILAATACHYGRDRRPGAIQVGDKIYHRTCHFIAPLINLLESIEKPFVDEKYHNQTGRSVLDDRANEGLLFLIKQRGQTVCFLKTWSPQDLILQNISEQMTTKLISNAQTSMQGVGLKWVQCLCGIWTWDHPYKLGPAQVTLSMCLGNTVVFWETV